MENKEKFATFFGEASKGRKLGAIFTWIAAVALIAALFVPAFGLDYSNKPAEGETPQPISSQINSSFDHSEDAKRLVSDLQEKDTSLVGYLTGDAAAITTVTTGVEAGNALNIVLLAVYVVLIIAAVVLALFTMNVLSLVATVGAAAEVLLLYFLSYSSKITELLNHFAAADAKPTLSVFMIAVLVLAVILQIVGVILTYAIHPDEEEEESFWDETSDDRNAETSLFDENTTPTSVQAAANLVQMNTSKVFSIPEGAELVIGKGSQANIIVSNPIISRAHAKISFRGGVCTIQDLGSKNGTFVGDQKLPNGGSAIVPNGAYITLGNEIFQFNF